MSIVINETVARSQATAPNSAQIRPATLNLVDLLRAAPGDPEFDLTNWKRQWSVVEAEQEAITQANDVAESRRAG